LLLTKNNNKGSVFYVLPRRDALHKWAGEKLQKAAESVKKSAQKRAGDNDNVCEVREVVHVLLKDENKAKVDSGYLTGVIVKVDTSCSMTHVADKS